MTYSIKKHDFDPDLVRFKTGLNDSEVFDYISSIVQDYLDENGPEEGKPDENASQELLDAMKSNDWRKLLEPANKYLYEFNGEWFEINEE